MLNKSECSKKFKKLCDRSVALTKKETRTVKEYSKLVNNYSSIEEKFGETRKKLNSINHMIKKKTQKLELIKQIDKEKEEELKEVDDEIKNLQEKLAALTTNGPESVNNLSPKEELLQAQLFRMCTKIFINDKNTTPNIIQGFIANSEHSATVPFEIDTEGKTEEEIADALWENVFRCSEYAEHWVNLFNAPSK